MDAPAIRPKVAYPRGSEWRKWDLHVHTPFSAMGNGFGKDFHAYAKVLFTKAVATEIAVIGVTDYFTIDGYKKLRVLQDDSSRLEELLGAELAESARTIRLLPNIEFRLGDFVRVGEQDSRVNAHVIFSDDVPSREIEENFLHRLLFVSASAPGDRDSAKPLKPSNLEEFGARLKAEHAEFANRSDLEVGMTQATVPHHSISEILGQSSNEAKLRLEAQLEQRRGELEALRNARPSEVTDPSKARSDSPDGEQAEKDGSPVV